MAKKYPLVLTEEGKSAAKKKTNKGTLKKMAPQEFLNAARPLKAGKGDRKLIDSFKHHINSGDVLGPLKLYADGKEDGRHRATAAKELGIKKVPVIDFRKPKKASGGAVPVRLPIDKEDPEAYFRRLIEWSFAVAPLFGRSAKADGGSVQDIEAAIRAAEAASKKKEESHEKGVSGAVEFAPVGVTEPLSGTRLPLGSLPKETAQVVEPALQAASEIAPYFTPAAPIAAARDVAVGLREGDPTNVALSALGLPGKAAKAAAIGASAFMPSEAEASPIDKALGIARRLTGTGHYSPAAEAAAALKQEKGPASQMIGGLKNLPGVKPEELKWSGIESAFHPSENVTRQQIMDYLHENLPQVKEKTYGGSPAVKYEPKALLERPKGFENTDDVYEVGPQGKPPHLIAVNGDNFDVWGPSGYHNSFDSFNDAVEYANQSIHGIEPTEYGQYTLPGGKNYREVLLHLPQETKTENEFHVTGALPDSFKSREEAESYVSELNRMAEQNPVHAQRLSRFPIEIVSREKSVLEPSFKSQHWNEPNVLGHLRMSDRTGPEGEKILHLEELQSDWAQKGRKQGFGEGKIPAAPYVTNTQHWTDLGLKRALREAAEGGYDKMIWTPGAEQAARYDLSKHIDELHWNAGNLVAYDPKGRKIIQRTGMSKEELPDLIGKEAAEKLLSQEADRGGWRYLDSEGLKVGGEGMQSFYDKIVPTQLSKIIKKLDPKTKIEMGAHKLEGKEGEDINAHAIHITPELRKRILEGLPAYAEGGAVGDQESPGFVDRALNLVSQFNPVGTAEAGPLSSIAKVARKVAEKPAPVALETALQRVASPFSEDPERVRQAIELARNLRINQATASPEKSYYKIGQSRPVQDVTTQIGDIPNLELKPEKKMSWEDFYNLAKGARFINLGGDRSNFGRLTHINEQELAWPVDLHAGTKYMREPSPGAIWANAPEVATSLKNAVREEAERGDVYGIFSPMGPQAVDSSHNMFDALMAQIPNQKISKKDAKAFDQAIMSGAHVGSGPEAKKMAEKLAQWPGINNPKEASEFARSLGGGDRRAIVQYMDTAGWRNKGFPMVGETRAAITDPELRGLSKGMMGHRIVKFNPENITPESVAFEHSTYPVPTGGEYVGDVPPVLRHYVMPEAVEEMVKQPAKDLSIIHPFSIDPKGRDSARKFFEEQKLRQEVNQRFLDSVMKGMERQSQYGLKRGGSVISDALDVVSSLPK